MVLSDLNRLHFVVVVVVVVGQHGKVAAAVAVAGVIAVEDTAVAVVELHVGLPEELLPDLLNLVVVVVVVLVVLLVPLPSLSQEQQQ